MSKLASFALLVSAGCASGAAESRLAVEVDPRIAAGDLPGAVAAYERVGVADDLRLRRLVELVVWRSLGSPDPLERERATRIVADVADPSLDRALPARLDDADPRVRAIAAVALASQLDEARSRLEAALSGADPEARALAIDGLAHLRDGKSWLPRLAVDVSPSVRARAAQAIGALEPSGGRELVRGLLGDTDPSVRAAAVRALGRLGASAAELEAALSDPSLGVRLAALSAIARLDGDPAELERVASRDDRFVALRAAVALARRGRLAGALDVVTRAAADRRPEARAAAMNAAGELGAPAAELASRLLRDPDLEVRLAAARALITVGRAGAALPVLVGALDTPSALDAADELNRLGDPRGRARLVAAASAADAATRCRALALLAPSPGSFPVLTHALADADPRVRLAAAEPLLRHAYRAFK